MAHIADDIQPGRQFTVVHPANTITPQADLITIEYTQYVGEKDTTYVWYRRKSHTGLLFREMGDFLTILNDPRIEKFNLRRFNP